MLTIRFRSAPTVHVSAHCNQSAVVKHAFHLNDVSTCMELL